MQEIQHEVPFGMVDCFDDILEALSVVGVAYPSFAKVFWDSTFQRRHPFVTRTVKEKMNEHSLRMAIIRFICGVAGGGMTKK